MKKILAIVLAMLMVIGMFAACGNIKSKETEKETEKQTETEKETEKELDADFGLDEGNGDGNGNGDEGNEIETGDGNGSQNGGDQTGSGNQGGDESNETYERTGDKITFGSYPQTEVTDEALVTTLNTKAGTLPTAENKQAWTSYGYYISSSNETDYMWYIDVTKGGEKYRGVYFTSYRPCWCDSSSTDNTHQDDNGYYVSTPEETKIYWFKYESISWTILSENTTDGTALILCDMIIDSQEYYDNYNNRTIENETIYPNNYEHSNVRKWLNDTFYETAFNTLQKALIITTTVDNSVESTGYAENQYACANTEDKIFLLSYQDVINEDYGFSSSHSADDEARQKQTTDYAQAQGAYTNTSTDYAGNGWWWLRSPYHNYSGSAREVYYDGPANVGDRVHGTYRGVLPALQIRLQALI